jgi:hypothetical protein
VMVCDGCGDAREPDLVKSKPGEIHYQPCQRCGEIGVRNSDDHYREIHRKKSNTGSYESSSYRGGKLVAKG